jgi:hypothetical protein
MTLKDALSCGSLGPVTTPTNSHTSMHENLRENDCYFYINITEKPTLHFVVQIRQGRHGGCWRVRTPKAKGRTSTLNPPNRAPSTYRIIPLHSRCRSSLLGQQSLPPSVLLRSRQLLQVCPLIHRHGERGLCKRPLPPPPPPKPTKPNFFPNFAKISRSIAIAMRVPCFIRGVGF